MASDGLAKRVKVSQFPAQGRYGQGVTAWKLSGDLKLIGLAVDKPNREVGIHLAKLAAKRVRLDDAPVRTRPSNGKSVVDLKEGDRVVALTVPWEAPAISIGESKTVKKDDEPEESASQMTMDLGEEKSSANPKPKAKTTSKKADTKTKTTAKTTAGKSTAKKTPSRKSTTKRNSARPKKKT